MAEQYKVSGKSLPFEKSAAQGTAKVETRPGGWLVVTGADGQRHRVMAAQSRGLFGASIDGRLWHGELIQRERAGSAAGGSDADLVAQFPGKVRKLLVVEGAKVQEGDPLLLVEAMKMEFSVKAPAAGTVSRILVKEGQQLSPGDRFLEIKPDGK